MLKRVEGISPASRLLGIPLPLLTPGLPPVHRLLCPKAGASNKEFYYGLFQSQMELHMKDWEIGNGNNVANRGSKKYRLLLHRTFLAFSKQ